MGERYQFHIMVKYGDEQRVFSIHKQFCWGRFILQDANRLTNTLSKTISISRYRLDEFGEYCKSILQVCVAPGGEHYYTGVHLDNAYETYLGDSNHGWCVIDVDVKDDSEGEQKVTVSTRFYDDSGDPVTNEKLLSNAVEDSPDELHKFCKGLITPLFNNTERDLQEIFNARVKLAQKKKGDK